MTATLANERDTDVGRKSTHPTIKLAPDLHRKIKLLTSDQPELEMTEYVDSKLRPIVDRDYVEYLKRSAAELKRLQKKGDAGPD